MADRKQDLNDCVLWKGKRYGPGKGVMVPEDFPKTLPTRKAGPSAENRPGTSGSGISLEEAPEHGIDAQGGFQMARGGKLPSESEADFQKRAAEDAESVAEAESDARAEMMPAKPKASKTEKAEK